MNGKIEDNKMASLVPVLMVHQKSRMYISGPIAHYDLEERKQTFRRYERAIRTCNHVPVNPFKNRLYRDGIGDEASWRDHMREDIRMLLGCDYIVMLPGWEHSKGCKLELDVASSCGIKVLILEARD